MGAGYPTAFQTRFSGKELFNDDRAFVGNRAADSSCTGRTRVESATCRSLGPLRKPDRRDVIGSGWRRPSSQGPSGSAVAVVRVIRDPTRFLFPQLFSFQGAAGSSVRVATDK